MRIIKFRTWDTQLNEWAVFAGLDLLDSEDNKLWLDDEDGRYVWQQFTGLKDKNDIEIYEGDIVTTGAVVKWSEKTASFIIQMKDFDLDLPLDKLEFEVTGNIYENPELLEQKDE